MTDQDPPAAPAKVPPNLASTYVAAHRYGFFERGGARLRFASWNAPGTPRGTVVLLPGRGEFIEKYATEVVGELLGRGFGVMAMDWRGQGLSQRMLTDPHKGHVDDFATYIADLQMFLDKLVVPMARRPVLALCHSMGSHIALRCLAENGSGPFSAGMLVTPMSGLKQEALLRFVLMLTPALASLEERYLPLGGPAVPTTRSFRFNILTHDERRYCFTTDWFAADARLALGGPTVGWARQAVRSMTVASGAGYLERISLPLIVLSAGEDRLVDADTHAPLARRLGNGRHLTIAGAYHEIMMETDEIRAQFWEAFDRLAETAKC